jgi:zinc/manganese transport system substrate-binding protein
VLWAGAGGPWSPGRTCGGNIAAQIGGAHVQVTSILSDPNADLHLYESDVASVLAAAEARLVIENGAGYDDFGSPLLGATRNSGRVVVSVQAVLGAYGPDVNPHFWYDISRVPQIAAGHRGSAGPARHVTTWCTIARRDRDRRVYAGQAPGA